MKQLCLFLIVALAALGASAQTEFEVGDLKYVNYSGTDVYCAGLASNAGSATSVSVPATVKYNNVTYTVQRIGRNAFADNDKLIMAFINCDVSGNAFRNCTSLRSVTLRPGVKEIESYAFSNTKFTSVVIPETATSVHSLAFYNSALETIGVETGSTKYAASGGMLFDKKLETLVIVPTHCKNVQEKLREIPFKAVGSYAFYQNADASVVDLPYGVESIGSYAFANSKVQSVKVPGSVKSWGANVFNNCAELRNLRINTLPFEINAYFLQNVPATCKLYVRNDDSPNNGGPYHWKKFDYWKNYTIDKGAYDFTSDTEVVYNNKPQVSTLAYTVTGTDEVQLVYGVDENGAGIRTNALKTEVPSSVTCLNKQYRVTSLGGHAFYENTTVQEIRLPESITNFDEAGYTFAGCTSLQWVNIPSKVNRIPMYCFRDVKISDIILPYGIKNIDMWAFQSPYIQKLLIPSSVNAFDGSQLMGATGLKELILNTSFVVDITNSYIKSQLPDLSGLKTYVPYHLLNVYQTMVTVGSWFGAHGTVAAGAYDIMKGTNGNYGYCTVTKPYDAAVGYGECVYVCGPNPLNVRRVDYGETFTTSGDARYKTTAIQATAFRGCSNLTDVFLRDTLTVIPDYAFLGTTQLTSFPFDDPYCQLKNIGREAFRNGGLTGDITLYRTLRDIGQSAFSNCSNLNSLTILNWSLPTDGYTPYSNMNSNFRCYVDLHHKYFDARYKLLFAGRDADEQQLLPFVYSIGPWTTLSQVCFWDGNGGLVDKPSISFENILDEGGKLYEIDASVALQFADKDHGKLPLREIDTTKGMGLPTETGLLAKLEPDHVYKLSRIGEDAYIGSRGLLPGGFTLSNDAFGYAYATDCGTAADPYTYKLDTYAETPTFKKVTSEEAYAWPGHAYLTLKDTGINIDELPAEITIMEPYVEIDEDYSTMTFYYDELRDQRTGWTYGLNGCQVWSSEFNFHGYKEWYYAPYSYTPDWAKDEILNGVEHVVFDASFKNARPVATGKWFKGMVNLKTITGMKENLNTSEVMCMDEMFASCKSLKSVDLSGFGSFVYTYAGMFSECTSLESIDISSLIIYISSDHRVNGNGSLIIGENTGVIGGMFNGCSALKTIYDRERSQGDFHSDEYGIIVDSYTVFEGCTSLVGGAGTVYDGSHTNMSYFHIDGGPSNPGYLTLKLRGDVNVDGTVGIGDIVAITNVMAGTETNPDIVARANVNGDDAVGIGDIVAITNIMAGIEN